MKGLQQDLAEESVSKSSVDFVKSSILKMFERDDDVPSEILDDRTYVYD